ncbi:MAG: class I tRNA ligase family protein, partial [Gemmatimonadota bacterium]
LHQAIRQVTDDFGRLSFNTAIAALMELLNELRAAGRMPTLDEVRPFVVMLGPIAPHAAEEMWGLLGGAPSMFDNATWPEWDAAKLETDLVEVPVQVNGKLRATVTAVRGASADDLRAAALSEESVRRHVEGSEIVKTIHVPDRLLNLVVRASRS